MNQKQDTIFELLMKELISSGPEVFREVLRTLFNEALKIAEMYVMGMSTRKVTKITEQLCGLKITSSQVSRLSKQLDQTLEKFRTRPLQDEYVFVYFDALYEKVRYDGVVRWPCLWL